jgi:hypothetical protein
MVMVQSTQRELKWELQDVTEHTRGIEIKCDLQDNVTQYTKESELQ